MKARFFSAYDFLPFAQQDEGLRSEPHYASDYEDDVSHSNTNNEDCNSKWDSHNHIVSIHAGDILSSSFLEQQVE